jgi:uncharacterized protein
MMVDSGENSVMAALDSSKSPSKAGVLIYIKVDDIQETLEKIHNIGCKVIRTKFDIGGGYGFSAIFEDPNLNHVGLWSNS